MADTSVVAAYSRAFGNFVQSDDDVVGLMAYALFKRGVREEAQRGRVSLGGDRDPPPTVVEAYRQAAEQRLAGVIQAAIDEARPELQSSAFMDAVEKSTADISNHITTRTDFKSALFMNLIAWFVTLGLTALIIWLLGKPDIVTAALNHSTEAAAKGTGTAAASAPARP